MRRAIELAMCLLFGVMCAGCRSSSIVGVWMPAEPSAYYFELYEDGSCMMFDDSDEWVSSGSYTRSKKAISFVTDTGSFMWVWDDESGSMLFETANGTLHYRKQEA